MHGHMNVKKMNQVTFMGKSIKKLPCAS